MQLAVGVCALLLLVDAAVKEPPDKHGSIEAGGLMAPLFAQ
jgi:hypothetical protein